MMSEAKFSLEKLMKFWPLVVVATGAIIGGIRLYSDITAIQDNNKTWRETL